MPDVGKQRRIASGVKKKRLRGSVVWRKRTKPGDSGARQPRQLAEPKKPKRLNDSGKKNATTRTKTKTKTRMEMLQMAMRMEMEMRIQMEMQMDSKVPMRMAREGVRATTTTVSVTKATVLRL